MQKNKIDVVKAACSSAAKKLVAICLMMVVGGKTVIDDKYGVVVSAQEREQAQGQEQVERDRLRERLSWLRDRLARIGQRDVAARFSGQIDRLDGILQRPFADLVDIADIIEELELSIISYEIPVEERLPYGTIGRNVRRGGPASRLLNPLNWLNALGRWCRDLLCAFGLISRPQQVTYGCVYGNHIIAGHASRVYSVSTHELIHEGEGLASITGPGPVSIGDAITISEPDHNHHRNVTVNLANRLTVAPRVNMLLRNGTEFEIGETAQDTLENLVRAMRSRGLSVSQVLKQIYGEK